MIFDVEHFSYSFWPLICSLWRTVYLRPLPILNLHIFGGLLNYRIPHAFWKLTLFRYVVCKYFLPFHGLSDNKSTDNKSKNEQVRLQSFKLLKLKYNLFVEKCINWYYYRVYPFKQLHTDQEIEHFRHSRFLSCAHSQ